MPSRTRGLRIEQFEQRMLLAIGPELVAVIPNAGDVLEADEVLDVAPREFLIRFSEGQDIDPATLAGIETVRHVGGADVTVQHGWAGIGDQANEVIIRYAETLPDGTYQINILGTGANPLTNMAGERFAGGSDESLPFELDLGAQVVAVVPQPVTRDVSVGLEQAADTVMVYFNDDDLDPTAATDPSFYNLIDTATSVPQSPSAVTYDEAADTAELVFASDLAAGTYRLTIGEQSTTQNMVNTSAWISRSYSLQMPGTTDEPGHRHIPPEDHGAAGTLGGTYSFSTRNYNFQDNYGSLLNGQTPQNLITENQKDRAREIFSLFGHYLGIEFVETDSSGWTVVTGDIRVLAPQYPSGPGGVGGISNGSTVVMNAGLDWGDSEYGGGWFNVAMHELGHNMGLMHAYDLPNLTIMGGWGSGEKVFPGDHDLVHLRTTFTPAGNDLDLYSFSLTEPGWLTAETIAERLPSSSLLNSKLTLYEERMESSGPVREVIASNDDYFSNDSFIGMHLEQGTYHIAVTSTGTTGFDPWLTDSGFGGTTEGAYDLKVDFTPDSTSPLLDASGTSFDGDADGKPGGTFDFWFNVQDPSGTYFVDKMGDPTTADGSLANPYTEIDLALAQATNDGDVVRIVGNAGADDDISTLLDNVPYLLGFDNYGNVLEDGARIQTPHGVTVMIDAGALLKMQKANIEVGSAAQGIDLAEGALQVLGTPEESVYFRSYRNDAVGGDDDGPSAGATSGDFGGLVFREDSDREDEGIFLNWVSHADINNGGGKVTVNSTEETFAPIHMITARPSVVFNHITNSAAAAMSADPDSFEDTPGRVGPDIHGNLLLDNTINGLFVRISTAFGSPVDSLEVSARWDDTDIVHVVTESLLINGTPGGPKDTTARFDGRLAVDPGLVVKLEGSRIDTEFGAQFIAEGLPGYPVVLTALKDDRFGAGGTFDTSGDQDRSTPAPGHWGGLVFRPTSLGNLDHVILSYAGGTTSIEGGFDQFNAVEINQADVRIANSAIRENASGRSSSNRNGLGYNVASTIFVRGAQPMILNNIFADNAGDVININANAMQARTVADTGRTTGPIEAFTQFADNHGPLVRLNRLGNNGTNGMAVRGATLTTQTIWDDTDIAHVLRNEIVVLNHHSSSGIRLQSNASSGLVVKLDGANAGFTANGTLLDIDDRIGGTIQIIGVPGRPVVLTSLADDSFPAGFDVDGNAQGDTNNDGPSTGQAGEWRSIRFEELANARNVSVVNEAEPAHTAGNDVNASPFDAEFLGNLAPDEKSGDDNRRLGFEVHGFISPDDANDVDVYSFHADTGAEVWIDIDRAGYSLDSVVELIQADGTVLASSVNNSTLSGSAQNMNKDAHLGGDFLTTDVNRDAGMRVVLPGQTGASALYFVRVTSNGGLSQGEYQLQVRLRQVDEFPGCTVRFADIHFATDGIEVLGMPAHSPLIGESGESAANNNTRGAAQELGNLLTSDRNTISVGGELSGRTDVDWYTFTVDYDLIQAIGGVNAGTKTFAAMFDIDYADGMTRADTVMSVFDSAGNLILVSRDSNVEDDQPGANQGADTDDLTRGSFGVLDPYIGTVQMPAGVIPAGITQQYYVAITSNYQIPTALNATFNGSNANALVRLEPVDSIDRVAEDHIGFQGFRSGHFSFGGRRVRPQTPSLLEIGNTQELRTHVRPFTFSDVALFVSTSGSGGRLYSYNPFNGSQITNIGALGGSGSGYGDLAMRTDGRLYAQTRGTSNAAAGNLRLINTGNAAATNVGDDGIGTNPNVGQQFDALAYRRTGVGAYMGYAANNRPADSNNNTGDGIFYGTPSLWRINPANGAVYDENTASTAPGLQPVGALPSGNVTGLAFATPSSRTLFAVTDTGVLYRATVASNGRSISAWTTVSTFAGLNFTGLTLGPQNLDVINSQDLDNDGFPDEQADGVAELANILFATASDGRMYAFNQSGVPQTVFDTTGNGLGNSSSVGLRGSITGLAFSPLDFNLWHPTMQRRADAGHGVLEAFDISRSNSTWRDTFNGRSGNLNQGGPSFYFGMENWGSQSAIDGASSNYYFDYGVNAQYGVRTQDAHRDLSANAAIGDNYNLPGGAHGSLITNSFSLAGSTYQDKPTLYFNYFLETQGTNAGNTGKNNMRDSARVMISKDGGSTWELLATNNSTLSSNIYTNELPRFISASSKAANHSRQRSQELFDNTGVWRQARVDLGDYADDTNLQLRFDFATAGRLPYGGMNTISAFGNLGHAGRGQNNDHEGFYVDDIIIGYAERGEMATGAGNVNTFFSVPQNPAIDAPLEILSGPYQLEIRRGTEYGMILNDAFPNILIYQQFDTNTQFVADQYRLGDSNVHRPQDQLQIVANTISDVSGYGIMVDAGARAAGSNMPYPGAVRNLPTLNNGRLIPGVTLVNNVIANVGQGGILFSGDPNTGNVPTAAVPFGLIVNNTVYGGSTAAGVGIAVTQNAGPTLLNNVLANTATGISIDSTSSPRTVVGSNLFQDNTANGTVGNNAIFLAPGDPLFVNPAAGNFYLASGSNAIDSSLDALLDRASIVAVKSPLAIPPSPIFAPEEDRFGQKRLDDPSQDPPPGMGLNIYKDRGAVERADFVGPTARLVVPEDGGLEDHDLADNDVILADARLTQFSIQLLDTGGIGIDDTTVTASTVEVYQNVGIPAAGTPALLSLNTDYLFNYDATNDLITIFPAPGVWQSGAAYTIVLDNTASGIQDLAANRLGPNRSVAPNAGMTIFNILLTGMDRGDAPEAPYPTLETSNGATHLVTGPYYLGSAPDWEPDAKQNADATGDLYDDGVRIDSALLMDSQADLTVTASIDGVLNAWIDFNGDGDWADAGEQVFVDTALVAGANALQVSVPDDSVVGLAPNTLEKLTFGRFRFSSQTGLAATGYASDGEVEDYQLRLVKFAEDFGDAPADNGSGGAMYPTLLAQNGASHFLDPAGPLLGAAVDAELDGQPDATATGDDNNGDDEDGIVLTQTPIIGGPAVSVGFDLTASPVGGFINAWIDYNQDGDWADAGEHAFVDEPVSAGIVNQLDLNVPATALSGYAMARVRVSSAAGLSYEGVALDGEVEDYVVPITSPPIADPGSGYTVDEGLDVTLDASASYDPDGTVVFYEWDLDNDGVFEIAGATDVTAVYRGKDDGVYTVALRVTDNAGATDTATTTVTVNNVAPTVDAGPDQNSDEGATVLFDGAFTDPAGILDTYTLDWDFGDGGTASGTKTPSHVYVDDGVYTVTLTVTDGDGGVGTDTLVVTVANLPPVVDAGPDQTIDEGGTASFFGSSTDLGGNDTHTYLWDFGDGSTDTVFPGNSHTYLDNGIYTVTLTVTDTADATSVGTDTLTVTVNNVAPTVSVGPDQSADEGQVLNFTGLLSDPGDDTYTIVWDFGDGDTDTYTDTVTGQKTISHAFADNGVYIVTLTITDDDGGVGTDTLTVTVFNVAPTADAGPDQTVNEGDTVVFAGDPGDPGSGDTHTFEWDFDGDGVIDTTGSATPTHVYTDDNTYTVTLTVTDDDGASDSDTMTVTVLNVAPTAVTGGPYYGDEGSPIAIDASGSFDPGLDIVSHEWDLDYDGVTFDVDVSGKTTDVSLPDDGTFNVALRVTDDDGAFDIATTTVFVQNVAPTVDAGPDQTIDEGDTASFTGLFTDPGILDTHTYFWDFGDGATDTAYRDTSHTYRDDGAYTVTVTVTDDDGGVGVDTLIVTVNNVAPTVDAGPDQTINEGDTASFFGSFTDPGPDDTHTYLWDFGDGNTDTGYPDNNHAYLDDGVYTVTLTVTDDDGGIGTDTLTVTVNNVAPVVDAGPDQTADEGSPVSFSGTSFDPGADTYTILWDFGDGSTDTYTDTVNGPKTTSHTFADNGVYTVTLTVTDDDGGVGTDTMIVTVNNVAPTVDAGPDQTADEGSPVSFSGTSFDPGADTYTILWDFGDGSTDTYTDTVNGPKTTSHTFADNGVYTVALTVTDDDGGVGTDTMIVTVNNVAPTVDAGPDQTADEGSPVSFSGTSFDPGADTYTILWDFGDGSTDTYTDTVNGPKTSSHTYADNGVYTVALTVTDDDGGVGTDTMIVTVNNVAPTVDAGPDQAVNEGELVNFDGWYDDPGSADIVTVQWDFGDGNTDSSGTSTPTHTYTDDGAYTVTMFATDDDGGIGTDTMVVTVANLPPVVDAGPDQAADEGDLLQFSGLFTDAGSDDTHTVAWDFGDGNLDTTGTLLPTHTYADNGTYTVTLTVTDDDGGVGIDTLDVVIGNLPPVPNAGVDQTVVEAATVDFTGMIFDAGSADTHTIVWDFGDGNTDSSNTTTPTHAYPDDGVFTVTMTVTDDDGGVGTDTMTVTVNNAIPIVDAGLNQIADEGDSLSFVGSFTDAGLLDTHTFAWDFGDGASDSGSLSANHIYFDDGTYTVTLTVTDDDGGVGTDTLVVTVNNVVPTADVGGPYVVDQGSGVLLDASGSTDPGMDIVLYEWDVDGDGQYDDTTGETQFVSWSFLVSLATDYPADPVTGLPSNAIGVRVTDANGATDIAATTLTVFDNRPFAVFSAAPNPATYAQAVGFDAGASWHGHPDRDVASYEWDFDYDGTTFDIDATGVTSTHAYPLFGQYTVALRVTDDNAVPQTDMATVVVDVSLGNQAPVADAGGPYLVDMGDNLVLDGSSSTDPDAIAGDSIVSYEWDLDNDGAFDDASGMYQSIDWATLVGLGVGYPADPVTGLPSNQISLRVTDGFGASDTATSSLLIPDNSIFPVLSAAPNPAAYGQTVDFDAAGSWHGHPFHGITTYEWDFDYDGTTFDVDATGATAARAYPLFGQYTVALRLTDDNVVPKTAIATVLVDVSLGNQAPVADANGPYVIDFGDDLQLDGSASSDPDAIAGDSIVSYEWDLDGDGVFGDATGAAALVPAIRMVGLTTDQALPVELLVTDGFGLTAIASTELTIIGNRPPTADPDGPYFVTEGSQLRFDGTGSSDDRGIVLYEWDLDYDGITFDVEQTGRQPAVTFNDDVTLRTIALRVTDAGGLTDIQTSTLEVTNVAPTVVVLSSVASVTEGTEVSLTSSKVDPGTADSHSYNWVVEKDGSLFVTGNTPALDFTPNDNGVYKVTLTVTDDDGGAGRDTVFIAGENAAPVVTDLQLNRSVIEVGEELVVTGAFTDAGPLDTHGVDVNWGDIITPATVNPITRTFTATHVYATAIDVFSVGATVTDNDGAGTATGVPVAVAHVLGPVGFSDEITGLDTSVRDFWYTVQAANKGWLTLEAIFEGSAGTVDVTLYDAGLNQIAVSSPLWGNQRIDHPVVAGEKFYVKLNGTSTEVGFRVTNLVDHTGSTVTVHGTENADSYEFVTDTPHQLLVNGVRYEFAPGEVDTIALDGGGERDTLVFSGGNADDAFTFNANGARTTTINNDQYSFTGSSVETVTFDGTTGNDSVVFIGTPGDETGKFWPDHGTFEDGHLSEIEQGIVGDFAVSVSNVSSITAYAALGINTANPADPTVAKGIDAVLMYDSPGDDTFQSKPFYGKMFGPTFNYETFGFVLNYGYATTRNGGFDVATMEDSAGNDKFKLDWPKEGQFFGKMYRGTYYNRAKMFEDISAQFSDDSAVDTARLYDSTGDDQFTGQKDSSQITGSAFDVTVSGYESLIAYASVGNDVATLLDSELDDTIRARSHKTRMYGTDSTGTEYSITARKFDEVHASANTVNGGFDFAKLHDSGGDDHLELTPGRATFARKVSGNPTDLLYEMLGFERVKAYAYQGGNDTVTMRDTPGDDHLEAKFVEESGVNHPWVGLWTGEGASELIYDVIAFDSIEAVSSGGRNTAQVAEGVDFLMLDDGWEQ